MAARRLLPRPEAARASSPATRKEESVKVKTKVSAGGGLISWINDS